jgi:molecular chaperone DnaJ
MSAWSLLGLTPGANLDEIKRAFQKRALETHPDQGGDSSDFRAVLRAYERLSRRPKARAPKR